MQNNPLQQAPMTVHTNLFYCTGKDEFDKFSRHSNSLWFGHFLKYKYDGVGATIAVSPAVLM